MEMRVCSFCGNPFEPGTGRMYVKKDGTVYNFCKTKCYKNLIYMGRVPSRTRWTQPFAKETGRQAYGKRRRKGHDAPAPKPEAALPKPKAKPALPAPEGEKAVPKPPKAPKTEKKPAAEVEAKPAPPAPKAKKGGK